MQTSVLPFFLSNIRTSEDLSSFLVFNPTMWQVLLAAAAAAGSGILAKKLISPIDTANPISDFKLNDQECDQNKCIQPQDSIFPCDDAFQENNSQEMREANSDGGKIFRFSSPETGSKDLRKKMGSGFRELEKNGGTKKGGKCWSVEGGEKGLVAKQRGNWSGKRISVCLKKRRTRKHAAGKCESCVSKDNSFGWGVGVGIMYMMSAGKAEISRLNCAMGETAKIVQELKAEISRRKSSCNENEAERNNKYIERNYNGPVFSMPGTKSKDNIKTFGPSSTEEGECASSVLTEDQQLEVLELDQLEAELESELEKLPWCATEGSGSERRTYIIEGEVLAKEDCPNSSSFQCGGVSPAELDTKLCHLLIEKQENQIMEFEAELHQTHSKLQEKEAELQALKDCVKRLTEFSLASASDEDTEGHEYDDKRSNGDDDKIGLESRKAIVGMKRGISYESYICSNK